MSQLQSQGSVLIDDRVDINSQRSTARVKQIGECVRQKSDKNRLAVTVLAALMAVSMLSAHAQTSILSSCSCDGTDIAERFAAAEHIVKVRIEEAWLNESSNSVVLDAAVEVTLRGEHQARRRLETLLHHDCPVDVYVGAEWVFFTGSGDLFVSRCSAPSIDGVHQPDATVFAIRLIQSARQGDIKLPASLLSGPLAVGTEASRIRSIMQIAGKLDGANAFIESSGVLIFGGLVVQLKNDRVVSHDWR